MPPASGSRPGGGYIVFKEVPLVARRPGLNSRRTQAVRGKRWILRSWDCDPRFPQGSRLYAGSQSRRSVLARRFGPRSIAVSVGSARCAVSPTRESSSATKRHPVVASRAKWPSRPSNGARNLRTAVRTRDDTTSLDLAGLGVQPLECDLLSMHVECPYNFHWDLLDSSARLMGPQHLLVPEPRGSLYMSSFRIGCLPAGLVVHSVIRRRLLLLHR